MRELGPRNMGDRPAGGQSAPGTVDGSGPKQVSIPINKAMEQAFKLYNAGRLDQAQLVCSQIVSARPRMAEAHNLLAAVLNAKGDRSAAVKSMQRAISLNGNNAQFYSNLGEMERQRGKLQEALTALRQSLAYNPKSPQTLNNLGILHYDRREFEDAVKCYREAISLNDSYAEAHNNLGNALRALRNNEEALEEYQKALLIRENYAEAYNNLAAVLREQDQVVEAEHAYRKAISIKPKYLEAYGNLATMLGQLDRSDDALRVLGEALEINPRHVPTLVQVARAQLSKGNQVQAEQACRFALKEDPESAEAHAVLGEVLHETDRYNEALVAYETALRLKPDLSEAHNHYGICLKSVGRLDEARQQFLQAIEKSPFAYGCYANLADLEKFTLDSPHLQAMQKIIDEASDPMSERYMALHFALGKALDDLGDHHKAFYHYKAGATMKRARLNYDEAEAFKFFDDIKERFGPEMFAKKPFDGHPSDLPLFIVGMPRSGSTMIEQILSSHPDVYGAGEIKEFSRRLGALRSRFPALPKFPDLAVKMNRAQYQIVADGYHETLRKFSPLAKRVTDKLLTNYYFVGMLHVLFPKARFIHTKRNPVDTCISAYTKLFKDDMPHSYDFGELGRYYLKYVELMDHWEAVLPPGVLKTVIYEDVVNDLEGSARQIIDFIGLPWDPACLSFHESVRPVKTASVVQVRKPVYSTSVERWRRYGAEIQPLIDALGFDAKGGDPRTEGVEQSP